MKYATFKQWFGKLVIMALVLCMVISMTACGKKADVDSGKETTSATTESKVETTEPSVEQEMTAPTEPEPPATEATVPEKAYVTMYATRAVNYRTGPSTDYEKIDSLSKGSVVQVVEGSLTENGWYEIQIDGKEYYVYGEYLSLTKPSEDNSSGTTPINTGASDGPTSTPAGTYVGRADTSKGISWDGVSPIIYTYPDGTTGTVPKEGATYESVPGITSTYKVYTSTVDEYRVDGGHICYLCGKVQGDGSNGTCLRYLMFGDECACCGEYVPKQICHSCDEG